MMNEPEEGCDGTMGGLAAGIRAWTTAGRWGLGFVLLLPLLLVPGAYAASPENPVILDVGGEKDTLADLNQAVNRYVPANSYHGGMTPERRRKYRDKALELLINRSLIYLGARKAGYRVAPGRVDEAVTKAISAAGSREAFDAALARMGFSMEDFRHRIEKELLVSEFSRKEIEDPARVSMEEARRYYEENRRRYRRPRSMELWHIILKVPPTASPEERLGQMKKALEIARRAREGEDFEALAEKYSEDEYRYVGGKLGRVHEGQLDPALEKAAFGLDEGEVGGPVETIYGYHVLRAGAKSDAGYVPFEQVRDKIVKQLEREKAEAVQQRVLARLREGVEIRVMLDD